MSSHESTSERVAVTMTPDAARRFYQALLWATAVAAVRADEWDGVDSDRARRFQEHAEWLRWGMSRVSQAVPGVIDA